MPYRTSAGIPFILRYPDKVPQNKVIKTALSSVDFAPSILSLMNVKEHGVHFDGIDFSSEVTNNHQTTNNSHTRYIFASNMDTSWAAAIMREYKLVVSYKDNPWLFDLEADPFEVVNFFENPDYVGVRRYLLDNLFIAMETYTDMPLKAISRYIWWDTPACLDSNDRIEVNSEYHTCNDIGKSLSFNKCNEDAFKNNCPVTCSSCCEDSVGKMWIDGSLYLCYQLKDKCDNKKVHRFCPISCGASCTLNEN